MSKMQLSNVLLKVSDVSAKTSENSPAAAPEKGAPKGPPARAQAPLKAEQPKAAATARASGARKKAAPAAPPSQPSLFSFFKAASNPKAA